MKKKKITNSKRLKKTIISIAILYILMIVSVVGLLSFAIMKQCKSYIMRETSALVAANSRQLELNISAYLDKIEKNVALLFSDEEYYLYDATADDIEEYDKIQFESAINNRIVDLGLMDNYADFCIVYANDHTVGWVSKITENMYSEGGMYDDLSSYITDEIASEAWCVGVRDNYDRMYFIKRLNPNAVLVASFFSNELDKVFEYPEELKGMTVRLVEEDGRILFSSDRDEISTMVSQEQKDYLVSDKSASAISNHVLFNTNTCDNGWIVMCLVSEEVVMKDFYALQQLVYYIALAVAVISVALCVTILNLLSRPVGGIVQSLYQKASFDALSGVMNKASFESSANDVIKSYPDFQFGLAMVDMDNFKQINDNFGHAYGDEVIRRFGTLLRNNFHSDSIMVGRLGGDEFAIFYFFKAEEQEVAQKRVYNRMTYLMDEFSLEFAAEKEKAGTSISIGIASTYDVEKDFDVLYRSADKALYVSKRNGKNQCTYFREEMNDDAS